MRGPLHVVISSLYNVFTKNKNAKKGTKTATVVFAQFPVVRNPHADSAPVVHLLP